VKAALAAVRDVQEITASCRFVDGANWTFE
jgi:hypothetical protein